MTVPYDHHYLPIFYLQRWCNSEHKVIRYYRPHRKVLASSIAPKNTGYESNLYSLPGHPPGKEQIIETEFMSKAVDDPAAVVLRSFMENGDRNLTNEQRVHWTRFLISLDLRNPTALSKISASAQQLVRDRLINLTEQDISVKFGRGAQNAYDWVTLNAPHYIKNMGKIFLPGLIDNEEIGDYMINMHWYIVDLSRSTTTLLVGDRPFIRSHGLIDPACVIALPVGPRMLFLATNTKERFNQILRFNATEIVKSINMNTVAQAAKQVYGCSDDHLRFASNRLRCVPL